MTYSTIKRLIIFSLTILVISSNANAELKLRGKALKFHKQYLLANPLYDDDELTEYVNRVGQKMVDVSPHAGEKYTFYLIDNPVPNASTPGGGVVYVHRGLLAIFDSEAQLAGVLAHEIGHNIGRHSAKRISQQRTGNILATAASILVGNSSIGDTIRLQNAANISRYGREQELEADGYAGQFLYAANYEPQQMLSALSQIADFSSYFSKLTGGQQVYHSTFTTHPKTDKRLHKILRQAGELPPGEAALGRDEYRAAIEGLVYGENRRDNAPDGYDRYNNKSLGITFLYPEDWTRTVKGPKIVLKNGEQTIQLKISIEKTIDKSLTTEQALKAKFPDNLFEVEKLNTQSQRDDGTIARYSTERVALSNVARNTFHFQGIARNNQLTKEQDKALVDVIRSFRRLGPKDKVVDSVLRIHFQRFEPGDTFASLAKGIGNGVTEVDLRILNAYYPKGEPEPGIWIKVLRKDSFE